MKPLLVLLLLTLTLVPRKGVAWGEAHRDITRAAIEVLPAWQRDMSILANFPFSMSVCTRSGMKQ